MSRKGSLSVSYTHLRAHETSLHLVCRLLLEKTCSKLSVSCSSRAVAATGTRGFLMIRRPPRSTHCISSAASDVYKRQDATFEPATFFLDSVEVEFGKFVSKGFVRNFLVFEHYKRRTLEKTCLKKRHFTMHNAHYTIQIALKILKMDCNIY